MHAWALKSMCAFHCMPCDMRVVCAPPPPPPPPTLLPPALIRLALRWLQLLPCTYMYASEARARRAFVQQQHRAGIAHEHGAVKAPHAQAPRGEASERMQHAVSAPGGMGGSLPAVPGAAAHAAACSRDADAGGGGGGVCSVNCRGIRSAGSVGAGAHALAASTCGRAGVSSATAQSSCLPPACAPAGPAHAGQPDAAADTAAGTLPLAPAAGGAVAARGAGAGTDPSAASWPTPASAARGLVVDGSAAPAPPPESALYRSPLHSLSLSTKVRPSGTYTHTCA